MSKIVKLVPDIKEHQSVNSIEIGQWYWIDDDRDVDDKKEDCDAKGRWFGCVIHIGSNFIKFRGQGERSWHTARIHMDEFFDRCELESDPQSVISKHAKLYRERVHKLMGRVQEITARLGVAPRAELSKGSETQALAIINEGQDINGYKAALVKAKAELLPDLFRQIREANEGLIGWMKAETIPLRAQSERMEKVVDSVDDRIFSVELYAGLVEEVVQVADGEPADGDERLHLMQRKHYMDEECLANYSTGGMDFKSIRAFDRWLAMEENRDRIFPFSRCMVAFQVRRDRKDYGYASTLLQFIQFSDFDKANKKTFLYIRNGDRLFRLSTEIEFDSKLFPDLDKSALTSGQKIWAETFAGNIQRLVTDDEYQQILSDYQQDLDEYKIEFANWKKEQEENKARGEPRKSSIFGPRKPEIWHQYSPFDEGNVYYDDISNTIAEDIKKHNRIALIIQGLLDRSQVLHPHPPYQIWTNEGFAQCIELIYDDSRALNPADMPDFEAYRQRLNASLKDGSITTGQELIWEMREAEKENNRMTYRSHSYRVETYRPYGNPGPGFVARVAKFGKRSRKCTFRWKRERQDWRSYKEDDIPCKLVVDAKDLLNVDAYTPGDYHRFFDDPRMRARYLEWAPLLLAAEDYHAGELQLGAPS